MAVGRGVIHCRGCPGLHQNLLKDSLKHLPSASHCTTSSPPTMQPRENKRARLLLPSTTLVALDNDTLIRCASYLDADGLAQLGRTSARFGASQAGQQRSLVNEAAHQCFGQSSTDEERGCLPKYGDESDIGLYRALELLRQPLSFDELAGNVFSLRENRARVTQCGPGGWSAALSGHVMRGGRHFVEFTIASSSIMLQVNLGVIRPVSLTNGIDFNADWAGMVDPIFVSSDWKFEISEKLRSQRTVKWGDSNIHCCVYDCDVGSCSLTDWGSNTRSPWWWQGEEGSGGSGTVGLLLDLDGGTLSVFKDGRRLGVMKNRLNGEYCWFVNAYSAGTTITMSKGMCPN